ncbi:MAG: serine/threonine-protein kinase, partial [Myxococcota bacterium]
MNVPQLGRYEVLEEIGQGGMSVVYRARDQQLNRIVAIKVLHDFLARQEEARRRFHREAVAVAKLHNPGIVEIFDYSGPDAEPSYIVCELIDGLTLRRYLEKHGPLPYPELGALVTAELTRALRHAHERGIIHRDLKPENIMISHEGRLKLMDFGIAQIMGNATPLTITGTMMGSPAHMAPEMIDGHPSDHRGDIFSVGTILYWLATGALPFDAPNPSALFRQILEGLYEPPQAIQPKMGNGLARIIERALATTPEDRYQDISELQEDLHRELDEVGLMPVESTAATYLAQPIAFSTSYRPSLLERLHRAGADALEDGNVGRAMDRFNRVLAIEPAHPEVLALVQKVGQRRALTARLQQTAAATAAIG